MNREIRSRLVLGVVLAAALDAAETDSRITVLVYNYAAIPADVLVQTEAESARIYRLGGIVIQWLDCPLTPAEANRFPSCQVPPGPTRLALRMLSQSMAEPLRQAQDSFGFALYPDDGSFAIVANVFAHDAEQFANRRGMRLGVILGDLVTHELGHLLLGSGSHAPSGIMHVPWHLKELEVISQGLMMFMPQETERMRTNVRARAARERAMEGALTPPTK